MYATRTDKGALCTSLTTPVVATADAAAANGKDDGGQVNGRTASGHLVIIDDDGTLSRFASPQLFFWEFALLSVIRCFSCSRCPVVA